MSETTVSARARALYDSAIVWDMVWPWEPWCGNGFDKLDRFREAGFTLISATVAGDNENISAAVQKIAQARAELLALDNVRLCETVADVRTAKRLGELGVLLHFEGSRCFERNLDMVEVYYKLGVRQAILAFNNANSAGGGAMDTADAGLTGYGRKLVAEMQRVGMLLDLSHSGHKTAMDAMEMSAAPCVYTHSNPAAVFAHPRNIGDGKIKACAATGGLVGIASSSMYHADPDCRPETLFAHLDHIVQLVGPDHAGLGLDYLFEVELVNDYMRDRPDEWPDARDPEWSGIKTALPEDVFVLTELMLRAGYRDEDVSNILGGNYMRVCDQVWRP